MKPAPQDHASDTEPGPEPQAPAGPGNRELAPPDLGPDHSQIPLAAPAAPGPTPAPRRAGSAGQPRRRKPSPPERRHGTPAKLRQPAPPPSRATLPDPEARSSKWARVALATVAIAQALYQAGRPITAIAKATGISAVTVSRYAKLQQWQRLTAGVPDGTATGGLDQRQASPEAGLAMIAHQQAARSLRERLATMCEDPRLGAAERGSLSKSALELSRALTAAIALERRLLGVEDAGGEARGPGVVIVVPQVSSPADWDKAARAHRKLAAPRRRAVVEVQDGPPPADDGDDSPDLDAED